jgi:hypothetical protein
MTVSKYVKWTSISSRMVPARRNQKSFCACLSSFEALPLLLHASVVLNICCSDKCCCSDAFCCSVSLARGPSNSRDPFRTSTFLPYSWYATAAYHVLDNSRHTWVNPHGEELCSLHAKHITSTRTSAARAAIGACCFVSSSSGHRSTSLAFPGALHDRGPLILITKLARETPRFCW